MEEFQLIPIEHRTHAVPISTRASILLGDQCLDVTSGVQKRFVQVCLLRLTWRVEE